MNTPILNRFGVTHVRDTMEQFVKATPTRGQARDSLRIGPNREPPPRRYDGRCGRCNLRPVPRDGWWELVWSEWPRTLVGPRARVVLGDRHLPTQCANGTKVWLCRHPCGAVSVVLNKPSHGTILFTAHPPLFRI